MYPTDVTWTQEMPSSTAVFATVPGRQWSWFGYEASSARGHFIVFACLVRKNICLTSLLCWNNLYNITSWASISKVQPVFKLCCNNSATLEPSINSITSVTDLHRPSCYPLTNRASFRPRVVLRRKAVLQVKKLKINRNFILKTGGIQWTAWDSNK